MAKVITYRKKTMAYGTRVPRHSRPFKVSQGNSQMLSIEGVSDSGAFI